MADRLAPLGPDAARLLDEARAVVSGGKRFRAAFCYWGFRAVRPGGRRRARAAPGLRGARAAPRQRAGPRRLHGRLRHPARPAGHPPRVRRRAPRRRLARRPGAVRRRRGDPARRPAAQLGRRAAAPLRAARCRGVGRDGRLRPVPLRGDRRAVPRRVGPGARAGRRRHRDDGAALQVGEVLHRAAAPHRRRPGRRRRRDPGRPELASASRWARRSSCATTCSASSATPTRPASRPATTWSRASAPCWSRWPSTPPARRTPRRWTGCSARRSTPAQVARAAQDHRRVRRPRAGRDGDQGAGRPGARRPRPVAASTTGRGSCSASSPSAATQRVV